MDIDQPPSTEQPSSHADKSHNLGDTLGLVGVAVAVIVWALVPTDIEKAVAIVGGGAILVYLAYRSHFTRKVPRPYQHGIAIFLLLFVVVGGGLQLRNQWRNEHHDGEQSKSEGGQTGVKQDNPQPKVTSQSMEQPPKRVIHKLPVKPTVQPPAAPLPPLPEDPLVIQVRTQLTNCDNFLKGSSYRQGSDMNRLMGMRARYLRLPDSPDRDFQRKQYENALKQEEDQFSQAELRLWNDGVGKDFWTIYSELESFTPPQRMPFSEFNIPSVPKPESLDGIKRACTDMSSMLARYKPLKSEVRPAMPQ